MHSSREGVHGEEGSPACTAPERGSMERRAAQHAAPFGGRLSDQTQNIGGVILVFRRHGGFLQADSVEHQKPTLSNVTDRLNVYNCLKILTHTHTHTRIYQNGNINCGFLFNSVITKQSS